MSFDSFITLMTRITCSNIYLIITDNRRCNSGKASLLSLVLSIPERNQLVSISSQSSRLELLETTTTLIGAS